MMDAAKAAGMSDPDKNSLFQRRWVEASVAATPHQTAETASADDELAITGLELLHEWRRMRSAMTGTR